MTARYPTSSGGLSLAELLKQHLQGSVRLQPNLLPGDHVITQGSCFARNIAHSLANIGVRTVHLAVNDEINTPFANAQFFRLLAGIEDDAFMQSSLKSLVEGSVLAEFQRLFSTARILILTVGVAPCWFLKGTDQIVLGPNKGQRELFEMRTQTPEWCASQLFQCIEAARAINPRVHLFLTLSPIPLHGTTEYVSALEADCVSKSTLRVAIDQVMRAGIANVHYWPSFEAVRWLAPHVTCPFDQADFRRLQGTVVAVITEAFVKQLGIVGAEPSPFTAEAEGSISLMQNF